MPRPTKPIARGKPPRRRKWLRQSRPKRRAEVERVDELPVFRDFVRAQECRVAVALGNRRECEGEIQAAHVGPRGLGIKCSDWTLTSLCSWHHLADSHDHATRGGRLGFIASIPKLERQAWYDEQAAATWALWQAWKGRIA